MTTDADRPLPAHIRRDLDRAARGEGRIPTAAHPDCVCGKPTGRSSTVFVDGDGNPAPILGRKADCPQHRPEPKA